MGRSILILDAPEDELLHRASRTVGVKDLETVTLHKQLIADALQRAGRLPGQQGAGLLIAIDPLELEIRAFIQLLGDLHRGVRIQNAVLKNAESEDRALDSVQF